MFIRHEDRIQHSTEIKTDRQTDRHTNTDIKKEKSHSTCPKMLIHGTR